MKRSHQAAQGKLASLNRESDKRLCSIDRKCNDTQFLLSQDIGRVWILLIGLHIEINNDCRVSSWRTREKYFERQQTEPAAEAHTKLTRRMEQSSRILVCSIVVLNFLAVKYTTASPTPSHRGIPSLCRVREYRDYRAEKPGCRPQPIVVDACYGFCDTFQIPILRPPFKQSQHRMCSYGSTVEVTIQLDDCDEGVDRTFTYINATNCVCRRCTPENTFCSGIHYS